MLVLYQGRKSLGAFVEKRPAYLLHQPACYTLPPAFGRHRQAIDITPPSVPSTDYRTDYPAVDYRDKEDRARFVDQTGSILRSNPSRWEV
jgi:hypothetical protein